MFQSMRLEIFSCLIAISKVYVDKILIVTLKGQQIYQHSVLKIFVV